MDAAAIARLFGPENVLVLAARPGCAARPCGGLIAGLCRMGRPPFVVVLSDGGAAPAAADRQARDGLAALGLEAGRLLLFGIPGAIPRAGATFDAAVAALGFVAWRHDCNMLCAPAPPDDAAPIARAAAAANGLGLVGYAGGGGTRFTPLLAPRRSARDTD